MSSLQDKVVLIVDDDVSVCDTLVKYFRKRGFNTVHAVTWQQALEVFIQSMPDIVLLDVMIPGMNGLELLRKMKKIRSSLKAVIISGVKDEGVFHQCMELGALDYIIKPFDLYSLDARVMGKLLAG